MLIGVTVLSVIENNVDDFGIFNKEAQNKNGTSFHIFIFFFFNLLHEK